MKKASGVLCAILVLGIVVLGHAGGRVPPDTESAASVAVDKSGNVYFANGQGLVRRIDASGVVSIYAGIGLTGFAGNGGPAKSAEIIAEGLAVDANGNLLIAGGGAVRKVNSDGVISTVAGVGPPGFSGDGRTATSAGITAHSVALDTAGNLYIAGDFAVRKVTPSGVISTIAGGPAGPFGFSGDGGPATSARMNNRLSVAVDRSGAVFIADWANQRIRKVTTDGVISTVAGSSLRPGRGRGSSGAQVFFIGGFGGDGGPAASAELLYPCGVAVDSSGALYIADLGNGRIRKLSSGIITTVAGNSGQSNGDGGPASSANIGRPCSVVFDANDTMFIGGGLQIRKVARDGTISTIWSRGTGVTTTPRGMNVRPAELRKASFASAPTLLLLCASAVVLLMMRRNAPR